jgi:hypothetical protein
MPHATHLAFLSDCDLAYIATNLERSPLALARELNRPYFTVAAARRRIAQRGWACPLAWESCTECGRAVSGPDRHPHRTAHVACESARAARLQRQYRKVRPGQSTPYVADWRRRNPERNAELREQDKARMRRAWPEVPAERRVALLDRAHEADQDGYAITLARANSSGALWTDDEDRYILEHPHQPARDIGLKLGRTLWAVRGRRMRLRRQKDAAGPAGSRTG